MDHGVVRLFGEIANAFLWPVAVALLVLLAYAMMDIGALVVEAWQRRSDAPLDVDTLATEIDRLVASRRSAVESTVAWPPAVRRMWRRIAQRLRTDDDAHFDLWLDEAVRGEELAVSARLDRGRALVRLGPMLGLAGTIIPLGPALQSLFGGDMAAMIDHLVFGFGAVVCGLVASGVAYVLTLVRERWSRVDMKAIEDMAELVMRALQRSSSPAEGGRHADVRTA